MSRPRVARFAGCAVALGFACLAFSVRPAAADTIDYTVNSTFTSSTPTTAVSGANEAFSFTFSEPSTLSSLTTTVPVDFTLGTGSCCTYSGTATVEYYASSQLGLFDIDFTEGSKDYTFELFGPQIYSGSGPSYTPSLGTFDIDSSGSISELLVNGAEDGTFSGGTVVASDVKTPEPSSLLMLGLGLCALAGLALRRRAPQAQSQAQA